MPANAERACLRLPPRVPRDVVLLRVRAWYRYNPVLGEFFRCRYDYPDGTRGFYIAEQGMSCAACLYLYCLTMSQYRTTHLYPRSITFPPQITWPSSANCGPSPSSSVTAFPPLWRVRTACFSWVDQRTAVGSLYSFICHLAHSECRIRNIDAEHVCSRNSVGKDGARARRLVYSAE